MVKLLPMPDYLIFLRPTSERSLELVHNFREIQLSLDSKDYILWIKFDKKYILMKHFFKIFGFRISCFHLWSDLFLVFDKAKEPEWYVIIWCTFFEVIFFLVIFIVWKSISTTFRKNSKNDRFFLNAAGLSTYYLLDKK